MNEIFSMNAIIIAAITIKNVECINADFFWDNEEIETALDQNIFTDLWGYGVNWTNKEDGWNIDKKLLILSAKKEIIRQMQIMPKFTKQGFKKMKIPKELHLRLLQARNNSVLSPEFCQIPNFENNC